MVRKDAIRSNKKKKVRPNPTTKITAARTEWSRPAKTYSFEIQQKLHKFTGPLDSDSIGWTWRAKKKCLVWAKFSLSEIHVFIWHLEPSSCHPWASRWGAASSASQKQWNCLSRCKQHSNNLAAARDMTSGTGSQKRGRKQLEMSNTCH